MTTIDHKERGWKPYRDAWGENRHQFLQADGRWQICAGNPHCRECIKAHQAKLAARRDKRRKAK